MASSSFDAVVVGAGPNGLTAAVLLSTAGLSVLVLERNARIGGSCRTESLTLPGFAHDVCGAIHPMGIVSPIFRRLPLAAHGLEWVVAPLPLAHPLDDGRAAVLARGVSATAGPLGPHDGPVWTHLMQPFVEGSDALFSSILRPVRLPTHPFLMARFGLAGLQSSQRLIARFADTPARALFAGCAAHSFLDLDAAGSASFGIVLAVAGQAVDWPVARRGSQQIVEALGSIARSNGCEIRTNVSVRSVDELPSSRAVLFDVTPRQLDAIAGARLPRRYQEQLRRYRYGPGAFKVDYALSGPIPWRAEACRHAATVHVGGTSDEVARSEAEMANGRICEQPFVLVAQQSQFDETRAPAGRHTGWAYCHVPHGSSVDMTGRIERQLERFAPGFRDLILGRHVMPPAALEAHNPNLVGGDIGGGANTLSQFLLRPFPRWNPYTTPDPRLFICSSSTPPGGGVHGMCGYWAARTVLRRVFGKTVPAALDIRDRVQRRAASGASDVWSPDA
jgi:phytoene dehydrogenase-like protein